MRQGVAVWVSGLLLVVATAATGQAQLFEQRDGIIGTVDGSSSARQGHYLALGLRKYWNSFTSYQFPDPDHPQLDPLSRLEWPWDQIYGVGRAGAYFGGFQLDIEGASTLSTASGPKAQDSDWENPATPGQKTTFSEGEAKPRGWTLDVGLSGELPSVARVRPVIGFRIQEFRFTYTDVLQGELAGGAEFLPGPIIEFSQRYRHWYGGAILTTGLPLGAFFGGGDSGRLLVRLQGDLAWVTANNIDFHTIRVPAPRYTTEATRGLSWHVNCAVGLDITGWLNMRAEGDFMRIRTRGSHTWSEPGTEETWAGAVVWSEQKYLSVIGTFLF